MLLDVYLFIVKFICFFVSITAAPRICKRVICMYAPRTHMPTFLISPSFKARRAIIAHLKRVEYLASLTNTPMDTLAHWPLRFMLLMCMQALTRMLLLEMAGSAWMEGCQVDGIRVHQLLRDGADVGDEAVQEVQGHAFADHDAEDLRFFFFGREGVVWTVG